VDSACKKKVVSSCRPASLYSSKASFCVSLVPKECDEMEREGPECEFQHLESKLPKWNGMPPPILAKKLKFEWVFIGSAV